MTTPPRILSDNDKTNILRASKSTLNGFLLARSVVLAGHDDADVLRHGTGVLLQIDEAPLVITGAHVIAEDRIRNIQIIGSDKQTNIRFAPIAKAHTGWRKVGQPDVGYLELDPKTLGMLPGKKFLRLADLEPFPPALSTDLVMLLGMPEVTHTVERGNIHTFESFSFFARVAHDIDWAKKRPVQIKVEYPNFIQNAFTDAEEELPEPHGMSGGGMWRARFAGADIWSVERLRLIGLIVEFIHETRHIRANALEHLLRLLAKKFPSAQKFLDEEIAKLNADGNPGESRAK